MSSRNIRKVYGDNRLPEPNEDSDDDYVPLYAKNTASKFTYEGLELSSHSEEDPEPSEPELDEEKSEPAPQTIKRNNRRKKKKQKKVKEVVNTEDGEDEIDKSVKEINALMGPPSPAVPSTSQSKKQSFIPEILLVQQKHLNVTNELKKLFGSDPAEERARRANRSAQLRVQKRSLIVPTVEYTGDFKSRGLSMSMTRRDDGTAHFTFDHSKEYRHRHQMLLHLTATVDSRNARPPLAIDEAQNNVHIEAMLQSADMLFQVEEYTSANTLVERCIAYMQFVAHPSFQLADPRTRLSYAYIENRPFHVAVLKYIHLLTNRACHRTALELAKMLLNLDPSDPLALLLVIDTLALRAREHQWLIDAVDHWSKERDAGFLFSIQYSYAMAHFHVISKRKGDLSKADDLLEAAMLRFPAVVTKLLECANVPAPAKLLNCALFTTIAQTKITKNLRELIYLYAKLTWSKWREPGVFEWLQRSAERLADKYNSDAATQERAKAVNNEQLNLFRSWPDEVIRHLCVIKPMANLLVDGAVPQVSTRLSADPAPPQNGINRYNYQLELLPSSNSSQSNLRLLLSMLAPTYEDLGEIHPEWN